LASGDKVPKIEIVNTASAGNEVIKTIDKPHTNWINSLAVLPNGYLASGSDDYTIKIWDINAAAGSEAIRTIIAHTSYVLALKVLANGDLASGAYDSKVKIWDI